MLEQPEIVVQSLDLEKKNKPEDVSAIYRQHGTPRLNRTCHMGDICVFFNDELHGGGAAFGRRYLDVIKKLYPNRVFRTCFEWCSGPGFIGYNMLANNVCERLWLGDVYQPALYAAKFTLDRAARRYRDKVMFLHMYETRHIPSDARFDLIVSNPPHWNLNESNFVSRIGESNRRRADTDWKIHEDFFLGIKRNLSPDGIILLQEHSAACGPETFRSFIEQGGLKITNAYWEPRKTDMYYLEVMHA